MILEKFDLKKHYPTVLSWWRSRLGIMLPIEFLSDEGIIIKTPDGKPVWAAWLFFSNSPIANIEWITAAPDATEEEKTAAFEIMLHHFRTLAKEAGAKYLCAITGNEHLNSRLEGAGFGILKDHYILMGSLEGKNVGIGKTGL